MVKARLLIGIFILLLLIPSMRSKGKENTYLTHGNIHISAAEVFSLQRLTSKNIANKQLLTATCKIKINGEINGVKIEGEIVIEGITIWECLAIKINDLFDKSY